MKKLIYIAAVALLAASCSDDTSYANLLNDENKAVNAFLADQRVVGEAPADSVFEVGPDAPYYQMDEDGNIYMQVLSEGDMSVRPVTDDRVYFRFTRYDLDYYVSGEEMEGAGNSDDISGDNGLGALYFLLDNTTLSSSVAFGTGLQVPMHYLGNEAEVNIVIKSQYGWTTEIANVVPFLYNVRYYSSPLCPWQSAVKEI